MALKFLCYTISQGHTDLNFWWSYLDLKKLLASSCRQKIIKELSKVKAIHIMGLVRRINSTYNETNRNFKILQKEGIVTDKRIGRMRMIRLNRENPRTVILLQALKILETENSITITH
jgi:predicted transcriptional regulator